MKASFRPDHIFGTEFEYNADGEIERIKQVTAGYGKVAVIDQLLETLRTGPDRIVYVGDGSSDIHVMLHINRRDGFTIAVSENKYLAPIAKRSVISDSALAILVPDPRGSCGLGYGADPRRVRRQGRAHPAVGQGTDRHADHRSHGHAGGRGAGGQRGLTLNLEIPALSLSSRAQSRDLRFARRGTMSRSDEPQVPPLGLKPSVELRIL